MCDVSVIIPIYNKGDNLLECLDSILNQTYVDFEVICVNDFSQDNSAEILKTYSSKDDRIKVITNNYNKGAAISRNIGISEAKGRYLLILDADDIFDKNLIKLSYEQCIYNNLDMLLFDYYKMDNVTKKRYECSVPISIRKILNKRVFSSEDIFDFSFQMCSAAPWVKMYRRDFVTKNNIMFQDLNSSNDAFFGRCLLLFNCKLGYLEKNLVTYRVNTTNQISKIKEDSIDNFLCAVIEIKRMLIQRNLFEKNKKSFFTYIFEVVLAYYSKMNIDLIAYLHKDVINKLENIFEGNSSFLNLYQSFLFRDLKKINYNLNILKKLNIYNYIFKYEKEKVYKLKEYINYSKKKVALWGYGYIGKQFYCECKIRNFLIDLVVDENYININNCLVNSPNNIKNNEYIVLITSAIYVKGILLALKKYNSQLKVIDLQSYFTYGFNLLDCVFNLDV